MNLALVIVAAVRISHPVTWVIAFLLMGRAHAQFASLMHEAAHRILFTNRRANDTVGQWLIAFPVFVPMADADGMSVAGIRMPASRTGPHHPWVKWAVASMEATLGKHVQVIPNSSGGLPGDVFVDFLNVPLVWVPHSYNGCKQHGPDEHFLASNAREGIAAFIRRIGIEEHLQQTRKRIVLDDDDGAHAHGAAFAGASGSICSACSTRVCML